MRLILSDDYFKRGRPTKTLQSQFTLDLSSKLLFQNISIKMNVQHELKLLVEEMKRLGSPGKWCPIVK